MIDFSRDLGELAEKKKGRRRWSRARCAAARSCNRRAGDNRYAVAARQPAQGRKGPGSAQSRCGSPWLGWNSIARVSFIASLRLGGAALSKPVGAGVGIT